MMHLDDTLACDQRCPNLFMFLEFRQCKSDRDCRATEKCWMEFCSGKFFTH